MNDRNISSQIKLNLFHLIRLPTNQNFDSSISYALLNTSYQQQNWKQSRSSLIDSSDLDIMSLNFFTVHTFCLKIMHVSNILKHQTYCWTLFAVQWNKTDLCYYFLWVLCFIKFTRKAKWSTEVFLELITKSWPFYTSDNGCRLPLRYIHFSRQKHFPLGYKMLCLKLWWGLNCVNFVKNIFQIILV